MWVRLPILAAALIAATAACTSRPDVTATPRAEPSSSGIAADLAAVGARAAHTATTLADGTVLVAGGCVVDGCGSATADTFLVAADGGSAVRGPSMSSPRDSHTATLLADGRVLLVGGFAGEGQGSLDSIDLFDPESDTITNVAHLHVARGGHAAALAVDGRVVITGGWIAPHTYTPTTELFDPRTGSLSDGPDLPWAADALDAVTLVDGRVLVTGGQVEPGVGTDAFAIFDPAANAWAETGRLLTARFKHAGVLLEDGSVLVVGGTTDDEVILASTEIFDPATGRFSNGPGLVEPRYKLPGGLLVLDDHRVAVAGGGRTVEVLDLASGESQVIDSFTGRGSFTTLSRLGSGGLLVVGGYDDRIALRRDVRVIHT